MPYCTEADIVAELKSISFSATTSVTSEAISDFIEQTDALINMHLQKRYSVPITGANSLLVIKKIAIDIIVYRVTKILDLSKSIPIPGQKLIQDITEGSAYRESMSVLKSIRDNKMDLPDETLINASSSLASFHSEAINSDIVPLFDITKQQW